MTERKLMLTVIIAVVLVVSIVFSVDIIPPAKRGVMVTFGKAGDNVLRSGLHIHLPYVQKVKKFSISPNEFDLKFGITSDAAVTSDLQSLGMSATIYWAYDETRLIEAISGYNNSSIQSMLKSAMKASVKEVIGKYTVQEVIENQARVSDEILSSVLLKLENKPISINMLTISNFDWSESYDNMINETMMKKQRVKQMEQEVQVAELEAQKQVKQAEAQKQAQIIASETAKEKIRIEAEAQVLKAEKNAEARKIEADAEAYYYSKLSESLDTQKAINAMTVMETEANKWDGRRIPLYVPMTANGTIVSLPSEIK